ncbi:hypothetical protein [Rubripirellula reticaptiva]|uniref:Uncharacterized protein n=1 Tax=Rubripirellula reticaptiva TaxID=2528013 RepID=A0A5C6EQ75_9BACT|nr:hypothetical protein [Rubripirellula reticaptiva]TWU51272.1 hypothetical protein Poly59_28640 [Rubripirellula reticaptiva]
MQRQRTLVYFFAYVAFAIAAMISVRADERKQADALVRYAETPKISDWALAGVIWSDASLAKKLASEAAKRSESPEQKEQLHAIAKTSSELVDALEMFGWKQIRHTSSKAKRESSLNPTSDLRNAGVALADSIDRAENTSTSPDETAFDPNKTIARKPSLDWSVKRFDTETQAGRDDPGLDDEQTGNNLRLNVDQYRVNDYIDETPAEALNRADAIEDGVEGVIAAAAGRRGMGRPSAEHISKREVHTRSATLPYAEDSIYDSDDYDPDVDYEIDNPLGGNSTNPASADLGDGDDGIDPDSPAKVIDGEDELIAAMARENKSNAKQSKRNVEMDRYTSKLSGNQQDANWVQFQLNANQATWSEFTTEENVVERTRMAVTKLKSHASAAMDATSSPRLIEILQTILK